MTTADLETRSLRFTERSRSRSRKNQNEKRKGNNFISFLFLILVSLCFRDRPEKDMPKFQEPEVPNFQASNKFALLDDASE